MRRKIGIIATIVLAGLAPVSLGAKAPAFDPRSGPDPSWPPPPGEARLKWVAMYHDEYDVGAVKRSKFIDILSGVKRTVFSLRRPVSVAADSEGRVFVGDLMLRAVVVIDPRNKVMAPFPTGMAFKQITGVAVDDNFVYVADAGAKQVLAFDKQGVSVGQFGRPGDLSRPDFLALSRDGRTLWVADSHRHQVLSFSTLTHEIQSVLGRRGNRPGEFNFPVSVAVLSNGDLAVGDFGNFRVQILSASGKPLKSFGMPGDSSGSMFRVKGVAVDPDDHLYVSDAAFGAIQVFDRTGQLLTFIGGHGVRKGYFDMPVGLCFQGGELFVADQLNARVQVIRYLGSGETSQGQN